MSDLKPSTTESAHLCGADCERCAKHDPRDRRDHGHLPRAMCPACSKRPCGSCGEPGPYTITLHGRPVPACLRHLNHWRTPAFNYTCPTPCVQQNHPGREHLDWLTGHVPAPPQTIGGSTGLVYCKACGFLLYSDRKGRTARADAPCTPVPIALPALRPRRRRCPMPTDHTPQAESDYGPVTRDAVLTEAIRLHDLRYGNAHCDRKYVQVCPRLLPLIFEAGQNLRDGSENRKTPASEVRDA